MSDAETDMPGATTGDRLLREHRFTRVPALTALSPAEALGRVPRRRGALSTFRRQLRNGLLTE